MCVCALQSCYKHIKCPSFCCWILLPLTGIANAVFSKTWLLRLFFFFFVVLLLLQVIALASKHTAHLRSNKYGSKNTRTRNTHYLDGHMWWAQQQAVGAEDSEIRKNAQQQNSTRQRRHMSENENNKRNKANAQQKQTTTKATYTNTNT